MRLAVRAMVCLLLPIAASAQTHKAASVHPAQTARKPPDISLQMPGADPLPLSKYRGKILALTFISTVCSHCQDFTRAIDPIARRYAPRGVQFVECAINDGAAMLLKGFVAQFHPPFPVGWATQEAAMYFLGATMMDDPRALFVPHMVLLDRRGLMRGDFEPGSDFYRDPATSVPAALEKLLRR